MTKLVLAEFRLHSVYPGSNSCDCWTGLICNVVGGLLCNTISDWYLCLPEGKRWLNKICWI